MPLRVVTIVEGDGEKDGAVRVVLERVWYELLGGDFLEVIPWRCKRDQLLKPKGLDPVVTAAAIKLHGTDRADLRRLLLILVDAEKDLPCQAAPDLLQRAKAIRSDTDIACVMPTPMFETWFAAAAISLRGENGLPADLPKSDDPEGQRLGKSWVRTHLPRKYKETVDQPKFAARMDLAECQASSPSFQKLCRELAARQPLLPPASSPSDT